jgi:hypothetical protein
VPSKIESRYVREWAVSGDWIAADCWWRLTKAWQFFVGGDLINAERERADNRGAEFLADVRAIDRVRMGVSYVF